MNSQQESDQHRRPQLSSRDVTSVPDALADWLSTVLPGHPAPLVTIDGGPSTTGMSSETLIVSAEWNESGSRIRRRWVARTEPNPRDVPVFPKYRLDHQFKLMQQLAQHDFPVPTVRWLEPSGRVLGTPFFLMDYVDGVPPPDVMPYTFPGNWLADAPTRYQRHAQNETVRVLALLHSMPKAASAFGYLNADLPPGPTALRRHFKWVERWYEFAARDLDRSPLLEEALAWLHRHWPHHADNAEPALLWGDSRIGNVLYHDFTPVAVLDWEMATLGPRELDVAWLIFSHQVFEQIARLAGLSGLPHLLREEDVRAEYRAHSGLDIEDLHWFYIYCGVMWGCVLMRTGLRRIHFGEVEQPDCIEDFFYHRIILERLLAGEALGAL